MYLLYIDESGDLNGWENQQNFVLGAIAIHEGQIQTLTTRLMEVQREFFPSVKIPLSFHAYEIRRGNGVYETISAAEREQLMDRIYGIIAETEFPKIVAFATAINITAVTSEEQVLHDVFEDLCSRFNLFLRRGFGKRIPNKGLLIIDQAHQKHYRQLIDNFKTSGTRYGYLDNIIDIPYFAGRKDTAMLQLADFCAYAVHRYYEINDRTYLDKIIRCFDKRRNYDIIDGLKHITQMECSCVTCTMRNAETSYRSVG